MYSTISIPETLVNYVFEYTSSCTHRNWISFETWFAVAIAESRIASPKKITNLAPPYTRYYSVNPLCSMRAPMTFRGIKEEGNAHSTHYNMDARAPGRILVIWVATWLRTILYSSYSNEECIQLVTSRIYSINKILIALFCKICSQNKSDCFVVYSKSWYIMVTYIQYLFLKIFLHIIEMMNFRFTRTFKYLSTAFFCVSIYFYIKIIIY